MKKHIFKAISYIENSNISFLSWIITLIFIIALRISIESGLENFKNRTWDYVFHDVIHSLLFFTITYICFVILLSRYLKEDIKKIANILTFGYLIILTPPIFDYIISQGEGFLSFYIFDSLRGLSWRFLTFFGDKPEIGITYGVRIEVAIALIFIFAYSLLKLSLKMKDGEKIVTKSLIVTFYAYIIFFILGTFPSWITILFDGISNGLFSVKELDVAKMFFTPKNVFAREVNDITISFNIKMASFYTLLLVPFFTSLSFIYFRKKFFAFIKNIRIPQLIYHGGLLSIGLLLSKQLTQTSWTFDFFNIVSFFTLAESISLAWIASVIFNDIVDRQIDQKTNPGRPLIKNIFSENEYLTIGIILFVFSVMFSAIISFKAALLLIVYQAIAWLYSGWPLRLKRFPILATFVSAAASLMILFIGFSLGSPSESIRELPFSIIILIVTSFTLSLPIKDFKDIEGDKKDGVFTIPVIFGESCGKLIVGAGVFFSFLLSIVILNESRLFWWALFFGGTAFWIINQMKRPAENRWLNYRNIFWWMLGIVSGYGLILVKIIFL